MALFERRHRTPPPAPRPVPTELDVLLAETVARHFDGRVEGATAHVGLGNLTIGCAVASSALQGDTWASPLYFSLSGSGFGKEPVFASVSGYGSSAEASVVEGACLWACAFGPVLRAGVAGLPDPDPGLVVTEAVVQGRPVRLAHARLDRALGPAADDPPVHWAAARAKLGGDPSLVPGYLRWDGLPDLHPTLSSVLSVFVLDGPAERTVEVKVHGTDVPHAADPLPAAAPSPDGVVVMLRELAVMTPLER